MNPSDWILTNSVRLSSQTANGSRRQVLVFRCVSFGSVNPKIAYSMVWSLSPTLVTVAEASPGRCDAASEVNDTLSGVSTGYELSSPGKLIPALQEARLSGLVFCVRGVIPATSLESDAADEDTPGVHGNPWTLQRVGRHISPLPSHLVADGDVCRGGNAGWVCWPR